MQPINLIIYNLILLLPWQTMAVTMPEYIWISPQQIARLPNTGPAWQNLKQQADQQLSRPNLADQNDPTNVQVLAKALVYVRSGQPGYRQAVIKACMQAINSENNGTTLAFGRELMAYVIAAQLVKLPPPQEQKFRHWLQQADPKHPVGINPKGASRQGHNIDGVLPEEQRRSGRFKWPPSKENYAWEALQGAIAQALILHRAGYNTFDWGDKALLRAYRWLHQQANYPAQGDDTWQPHLVNYYYHSTFPAPVPSRPGKNIGWTDWTHGNLQ